MSLSQKDMDYDGQKPKKTKTKARNIRISSDLTSVIYMPTQQIKIKS